MERLEEKEWLGKGECRAPEEGQGEGETEDGYGCVPIALSNPGPVKPFEALTEMFSLPGYREIDPTALVALVFPFFFGFMIGDAGYGALLILTGVIFRVKLKKWEGFPQIGWYIIVAGSVALVLGLFLFGEAFGLPFHAPPGGTESMDWQGLTGLDVPLRGTVHKLESSGLGTLMMFSVLAGVVHLSLGNILGAINERRHGWKHSAGKLGWLMVVLGFGLFLFKFGESTTIGAWLWSGPMGALSVSWDPGIGIMFPYASIILLAAGAAIAVVLEGGMAILETLGVLSNILSYTRIAAIGVAKAAMAFAFNILLIPWVISGNILMVVGGWILLVLAHMLVFILGGLSSGIQALRLNLVEFFMKFYKGGGVKFNPFGYARKYTVEN
jgi:V/A-type H+-transporting ATPase subunit I